MAVWTISDTHFGNSNIIKYCNRPYLDSPQQTEDLIARWNAVVKPEDCVIHCGDFIMGPASNVHAILPRLNGNIILVRGNHDTDAKLEIYRTEFQHKVILKDLHYMQFRGLWFIFCHFPLVNQEFGKMVAATHDHVTFIHGHVHDKVPFTNPDLHSFNVCVDVTGFNPVSMHTIAALAEQMKGR